jgi:glycosyltransferase involved in cell wall biosynthesis
VVRRYSNAKVVLRAHNIEHLIWKRVASEEKNFLKKAYLKHLAKTLELFEKGVLDKFDGIVPVTAKDAEFFKANSDVPVEDAPFSIDTEKLSAYYNPVPEHALFHIGSMNWMPNEEGIKWLVREVWPEVSKIHPELKLYLAGREMPQWLTALKMKNLEVVGEVDDAYEFIGSKAILVTPLFSGSGIRVKIIESMALGKAVISTSIGAEGINYTDGKDILIANDREAFIQAISKLYKDKTYTAELGKNALKLIKEQHDINKVITKLERFYNRLIQS